MQVYAITNGKASEILVSPLFVNINKQDWINFGLANDRIIENCPVKEAKIPSG